MKILRPEEVTDITKLRWDPLTPEEEKEAMRLAREAFTADDLQKFTDLSDCVPMNEILREMEERQRKSDEERSRDKA